MTTDIEQAAILRRDLAQKRCNHTFIDSQQACIECGWRPGERPPEDSRVWLLLSIEDCEDLAAGCVPLSVRAMARMGCEDVTTMLRRNAARPVRRRKKSA